MTDDELAEIEARAAAATPGPWKWSTGRDMLYAHVDGRNEYLLWTGSELPVDGPPTWASALAASGDLAIRDAEANALFMAQAREDVPALVAEVRRLKGLVEEMERQFGAAPP